MSDNEKSENLITNVTRLIKVLFSEEKKNLIYSYTLYFTYFNNKQQRRFNKTVKSYYPNNRHYHGNRNLIKTTVKI